MNNETSIHIWRAPIILAVLSAFGLTAALVWDGFGDAVGSLALALPAAVVCWCAVPGAVKSERR